MPRDYTGIDFPVVVPSWKVEFGFNSFKNSGLLAKLPAPLQASAQLAYDNSTALTITQAECDTIDDPTWAELSSKLELDHAPPPTNQVG
jgi:hypothetical protein